MKVSTAIELLKELDPNAQIAAQWYDQEDMTAYGDDEMNTEVWNLAMEIFNNYEFPDMHYAVEQAIDEAKQRLAKEKN